MHLSWQHKLPNLNIAKNAHRRYLYILIGSDNGMVGRFNKEIIEKVNSDLRQKHLSKQDVLFLVIGKRLAMLAEQTNWQIWTMYANANSVKAVSSLAESIILKIDEVTQKERISNVCVWYHQRYGNASVRLDAREIIPISLENIEKLKTQSGILTIFLWLHYLRKNVKFVN